MTLMYANSDALIVNNNYDKFEWSTDAIDWTPLKETTTVADIGDTVYLRPIDKYTDFSHLFENNAGLNKAKVPGFNPDHALMTYIMRSMFSNCSILKEVEFIGIDSAEDTKEIFDGCTNMNNIIFTDCGADFINMVLNAIYPESNDQPMIDVSEMEVHIGGEGHSELDSDCIARLESAGLTIVDKTIESYSLRQPVLTKEYIDSLTKAEIKEILDTNGISYKYADTLQTLRELAYTLI